MRSEAGFGGAAVRYASVWLRIQVLEIHGRARTAAMGAVMPATPPGFLPLTCRRRLGPAGPAAGPVREPGGTSSSPGARLPAQPRTMGGLRLVRRRCRIDIDVEEPGERQGCQRLRDLLLVSGDDLDERCLPWLGNVVGTYLPLRAQRLKLLMLVISQRGEFCEVASSRMIPTTMKVCVAAESGVVDIGLSFRWRSFSASTDCSTHSPFVRPRRGGSSMRLGVSRKVHRVG
jgi:hypothetical protein